MPIYLDHNATTPVDPKVLERMLPYFTEIFGNAASVDHLHGAHANRAVEEARTQIANAIAADPAELIFTSGATESNNLAILGAAAANKARGRHAITTAIEHPSVRESFDTLVADGFDVTVLPVEKNGRVDVAALETALRPDTILVSVMAANNEIGTIQPIGQIGKLLSQRNVIFHTDAAQALAHVDLNVDRDCVQLMSLSAHKCYGPKGVGALFVRRRKGRVALSPMSHGGGHERGLRSGTMNVPGVVGFGVAAALAKANRAKETKRIEKLRSRLMDLLMKGVPDLVVNGSMEYRLPGNLNIQIPGVENRAIIQLVSSAVSISAGSACTTTEVTPSHVLLAIGRSEIEAHESIRLSVGRFTTPQDIDVTCQCLLKAVGQLRRIRLAASSRS